MTLNNPAGKRQGFPAHAPPARFQVLFHSPPGVLFTFPSRYYALSVDISILAWRVVPPASHKVSRVSWYSGTTHSGILL